MSGTGSAAATCGCGCGRGRDTCSLVDIAATEGYETSHLLTEVSGKGGIKYPASLQSRRDNAAIDVNQLIASINDINGLVYIPTGTVRTAQCYRHSPIDKIPVRGLASRKPRVGPTLQERKRAENYNK